MVMFMLCSFSFAESNLQTFPPSATQGKISGGSNPPRDADGRIFCYSCFFYIS